MYFLHIRKHSTVCIKTQPPRPQISSSTNSVHLVIEADAQTQADTQSLVLVTSPNITDCDLTQG